MTDRINPPSRIAPRFLHARWMTSPDLPLSECRRTVTFVRTAVLASSILLMLPGAWGNSASVVEFAQLPAGLAAWQSHSPGIYRVCGPVSKFIYALPAHLAGIRVEYPAAFDSDVRLRREWELGRLFQSQYREHYHDIYRWSRLFPILVTILGGCLICEWSTRLFGVWPGILSLCVWCWMPPILAHGSVVTSDIFAAVMLILASRSFLSFLLHPGIMTAVPVGVTLGLAAATKFTLLVLYPCWVLLLIGRALRPRRGVTVGSGERLMSPARLIALGVATLVISVFVIDAVYLFQDVGFRLVQWKSGLSHLAKELQGLAEQPATAWLFQIPLPIPLEFLHGLDCQLADTERIQTAYLLGRTHLGGWWYWYPVAALIKIPLPAIALFGLALFHLRKSLRQADHIFWAALCLLFPAAEAAFMIMVSTGTGTNAAFRYVIPSIALMCVWAGQCWNSTSRVVRSVVIGLLGWLLLNAVVNPTDYLGWQNELGWAWNHWSGQPALIGDSLDWGQDLARLGDWVSRHSSEGSTLVCVYGLGDGDVYGLRSPSAKAVCTPSERARYLAVSKDILFGYESGSSVAIERDSCYLGPQERQSLLQLKPFTTVGVTIQIYRVEDLPFDLPKKHSR